MLHTTRTLHVLTWNPSTRNRHVFIRCCWMPQKPPWPCHAVMVTNSAQPPTTLCSTRTRCAVQSRRLLGHQTGKLLSSLLGSIEYCHEQIDAARKYVTMRMIFHTVNM